jgi:hypothetical protein
MSRDEKCNADLKGSFGSNATSDSGSLSSAGPPKPTSIWWKRAILGLLEAPKLAVQSLEPSL